TAHQSCTNHPLKCPLCSTFVWKYNLIHHIIDTHPTADKTLYESHYALDAKEVIAMKKIYLTPQRSKKSKQIKALAISANHSSCFAFT
ncbi:hypothetical protein CPB84DRAFT_1683196, partial [Gymnopilus junonius]